MAGNEEVTMKDLLENLSLFGTLIGLGAIWFVIPTLVVFPLMYRLKKGEWRFPCNFVDVITICSVCILWVKFADNDALGRGLGLFADLIAIGFVYGILFLIRALFLWRNIRNRMMASILTLVLSDLVMLLLGMTGIMGKE